MWPNPQFPAGLVTFIGKILNGKLPRMCIVKKKIMQKAIKSLTQICHKRTKRFFFYQQISINDFHFSSILKDNIVYCIFFWNRSGVWIRVYPYNETFNETYIFQNFLTHLAVYIRVCNYLLSIFPMF